MRIAHAVCLATAAAGMLLAPAREASAQEAPVVVLRFHKAGDTLSIRGATVTIDHSIEAGLTDSAGRVRVPDLEDGGHIVEVVARGYQAFFDNFKSGPGIRMPIEFEILAFEVVAKAKGQPTDLRAQEFDKRRAAAQGRFFTLAQLKAASGRPLGNLLKVGATAFIESGPRGESFLASGAQPRPATSCYSAVVRDGLRIFPFGDAATPPDLDKIFTDDLAAVELYARPAIVPAELKDVAKCGALLLWSR